MSWEMIGFCLFLLEQDFKVVSSDAILRIATRSDAAKADQVNIHVNVYYIRIISLSAHRYTCISGEYLDAQLYTAGES